MHGPNRAWTFTDLPTPLRESDYVSIHAAPDAADAPPDRRCRARGHEAGSLLYQHRLRGAGWWTIAPLLDALRSGHLGGAGSMLEGGADAELKLRRQELLALPNVVGMPHSAASTRQGLARTNMITARTVVAVLDGEEPPEGCGHRRWAPLPLGAAPLLQPSLRRP